jgi:haloalkane dehalogenase
MHYADEGSGTPIVLLHGEPTWSYLYRDIIPYLATAHRVIAPDYLGFGKSDSPIGVEYTALEHVERLEALIEQLDLRDVTLVMHDWGGMIGGLVAARRPERFARLVVMNCFLPFGLPGDPVRLMRNVREAEYFRWMAGLYARDTLDIVLGEFGTIVLSVMKTMQGFERSERIDATWLRAYGAPLATPDECRAAIAFPKSIVSGRLRIERAAPEAVARLRALPAIAIVGMRDRVLLPQHVIAGFEEAYPGAPIHRLERAGHFLQEDEPLDIARLIAAFAAS